MNEKEEKVGDGEEKKDSGKDNHDGDKPKSLTLYEQTNAATERLEKANSKTEEILNRQEKLYEVQKLSGEGGGRVDLKEPEEETPLQYAEKVMGNIKE